MIKIIDNKIIFSELNKLDKDILLTFQKIDMTDIIPVNTKKYVPYEWLFSHIKFYPIWTIKIPKYKLKNEEYINNKIGMNSLRRRKYLFILDAEKYTPIIINRIRWDILREDMECQREQQYGFEDLLQSCNSSSVLLINKINSDSILKIIS